MTHYDNVGTGTKTATKKSILEKVSSFSRFGWNGLPDPDIELSNINSIINLNGDGKYVLAKPGTGEILLTISPMNKVGNIVQGCSTTGHIVVVHLPTAP